jgi:hypothetical protein
MIYLRAEKDTDDPDVPATFTVNLQDQAGNVRERNPGVTELSLVKNQARRAFSGLSKNERFVNLLAGGKGLDRVEATVNGQRFVREGLAPGELARIDVGSALKADSSNQVTLTLTGDPGATAQALVGDATLVPLTGTWSNGAVTGDVTEDGKIDVRDVVRLLRSIPGIEPLTDRESAVADMNADRRTDVNDVVALLKKVVGK